MVKRLMSAARRSWQFSLALVALVVGAVFQLTGMHHVAHWVLGVVALLLCVPRISAMWDEFRHGSYGFDVLALLSIIVSVLLHQQWAAIVIVITLAVSELLQEFAERQAHRELGNLRERAPRQAHVLRGRKEIDVAASEVRAGDKLVVKVGETVPVDAVIIEGASTFDELPLSGETQPVELTVDGMILSGSINLDGVIVAKALHSAADSQYQQIVRLVENAASKQAPFVRLAERYSLPFTVTALIVAGAAWYVGHSSLRFLEVIIVATPAPLLLAAPIALMAGMSRASRQGIIIRTGSALQKLAEAKTFAFDKTGTLTSGQPRVEKVISLKPFSQNEILGMAASLEQGSAHILGRAIVQEADSRGFNYTKAKHTQAANGLGMRGMLQGKEVLVGQQGLLEEHDIQIPAKYLAKSTVAYVAHGGALVGVIVFADEPRTEAKPVLGLLRKFGIKKFLMITADNEATAQAVATELGIDEVHAQASPGDKLRAIEGIVERPVVFVGNGVHDASVLTAADVGIALGARGSTIAGEAADVIIMSDDIRDVSRAVAIAQRTLGIARQSIVVGILLSLILMGIFFTGKFPPLLGAALQAIIDVFVIFNALRAHLDKA